MSIQTLFLRSLLTIGIIVIARAEPPAPDGSEPTQNPDRGTFVPNAGFTRTVKAERLQRELAAKRTIPGAPTVRALKGSRFLPVICVKFKNVPEPFPAQEYQDLLFGPTTKKTMTQYYSDISNGKLRLTGKVVGWYQLPDDDTFYENNKQGDGPPFGQLLKLAFEKADAEIDFGRFDNDGPDGVPNSGDDDGTVDTVVIIHSDSGGECNGGRSPHIWSHSGHYSQAGYGHSEKPFTTRAIRRDANGAPVLGPDGTPQHIVIDDYIIQPAISCPKSGTQKQKIQIGVFCHEYGHALGLPDLYDRTPRRDPDSEGVGSWCLMAAGSYGGDDAHPDTPVSMSAWCKQYLGWANVQRVNNAGEIPLEAVEDRNTIYRIDVPATDTKEYFLIEYRNSSWKDPSGARINWDVDIPISGLAIWHVDERVGAQLSNPSVPNPYWPFAPFDEGQNDAPSLPDGSHSKYLKGHSLVTLVEADGQLNLARGQYRAGKGDLWTTGMSFEDDPTFVRGSRSYDGQKTGISLTAINLADYSALAQNATRIAVPADPMDGSSQPAPSPESDAASVASSGSASTVTEGSPSPGAFAPSTKIRSAAPPLRTSRAQASSALATAEEAQSESVNQRSNSATTLTNRLIASNPVEPARAASLSNLNRVLNQADVELTDIQSQKEKKPLVVKLNEHLAKEGLDKISAEDLAKIAKAPPGEINKTIEPDNRQVVKALGAEARTKELSPSAPASNPAESDIVKLMSAAKQKESAHIQSSPEGTRLERVTDLSLPAKTSNIAADAARVSKEVQQAIGEGVELKPKEKPTAESSTGTVAKFQQVIKSDQKALPIFGTEAALYYSKGANPKLTAITNKTVDAKELTVTGAAGELPTSEAKAIVSDQLKVDPKLLREGTEGVYVVGDNPKNARVAVLVPVRVDDKHEDIKVFVDSQTKEILEIK
jgi:M6 family metalloprotease-like protein